MIAIGFVCGLALGVVLGAVLWSGAQYVARKAAEREHQKRMAAWRQEAVLQRKQIEKAKADLRREYGDTLTPEQERIMERELESIFKDRPNPGIPKGS
ncbi:MAG TPA: hypothetical protein VEA41_18930 [Salinarimonas sp.]|nr:hypothetical protein [Salinarimonas sp.]